MQGCLKLGRGPVLWFLIAAVYSCLAVSEADAQAIAWSDPEPLADDFFTNGYIALDVATDGAGNWIRVIDYPNPGGDIYWMHSADNGQTWSDPLLVTNDGGGGVGDALRDARPMVHSDGADTWLVVWERGASLYYARSTDLGQTWTGPAALRIPPRSDSGAHVATDGRVRG